MTLDSITNMRISKISKGNIQKTNSIYYKKQLPKFESIEEYTDHIFPPNINSIYNSYTKNETSSNTIESSNNQFKELIFERPNKIFKGKKFCLWNKILIEEVHQGQLDNSYYLSAISALAGFPERFESIFLNKSLSINGCYAVNFFINGKPKIITIDDYFPCHPNKTFAFSYSGPGEIWVQLLEKAWAKINFSYANTIGGSSCEALSSLTNAPCFTYLHRKFDQPIEIWNLLKNNNNKQYISCTNSIQSKEADSLGLLSSHSYSIVSLNEYKDLKLIKLMNPWCAYEWKGEYSDGSPLWTNELRNAVGQSDKDEGMFFIKFEHFLKYFSTTYVCKYEKGFIYNYKEFNQNPPDSMVSAKIIITNPGKIVIGLHQKQKRFYNKVNQYSAGYCRLIIAQYINGKYEYISSHSCKDEKCYIELDKIECGEYHLFSRVDWPYMEDSCSYVLSTYSEFDVKIEQNTDIPEDYLKDLLTNFIIKKGNSYKLPENINNIKMNISIDDNNLGYLIIMLKNLNQTELSIFSMEIKFSNQSLNLISKHSLLELSRTTRGDNGNKNFEGVLKIPIESNGTELVVFEIRDVFWNCPLKFDKFENYFLNFENPEKKDPIKLILMKNLHLIPKEQIYSELEYFEFCNDKNVYIVFVNISNSNIFSIKINFSNLVNLKNSKKIKILEIHPKKFEYITLKKINSLENYDFTLIFSLKKI